MAPQGKWTVPILCALLFALAVTYAAAAPDAAAPIAGGQPAALIQGRTPVAEEVPDRTAMIQAIQASSVKVILGHEDQSGAVSDEQSSSGVCIYSEQGPQPWSLILTNAHAVNTHGLGPGAGAFVSYVAPTGRRVLRAKTVAQGDQNSIDLALVRVEGVALPPVQFQEMSRVQLGSPVLVASSPFGRELSITSGIISQLYLSGPPALEAAACPPGRREKLCTEPRPLEEIFKTDAPICYGSSGGGVFLAATGRLVGLVESYQSADIIIRPKAGEQYKIQIPVPGESFLISVNKIKYFLEHNGYSLNGPAVLLTSSQAK